MEAFSEKAVLLCLVQLPPPVHGPAVMNEFLLRSSLIRSHFRVNVIALRFAGFLRDVGKFKAAKLLKAFHLAIKLAQYCINTRPDLAYFTISPVGGAFLRDVLFAFILKIMKIPIVYHIHGKGVSEASSSPIARWLYSYVFKGEKVIQLSARLYPDVSDFVRVKDCFFVANGIPDDCHPAKSDAIVEGDSDRPHILYLSNMIVTKGPLILLEGLMHLRRAGFSFKASFAGEWSSEKLKAAFYAVIEKYELEGDVEYLGPLYGERKKDLLKSADIFVLPTYKEAFPLVILEAMCHGLPVISTTEGGIPDIVADGESGYLVAPLDSGALADRLCTLLTDEGLRKRLGEAGRQRYEKYFTLESFETNLLETLKRCMKR
jgi:glycosyltransferase involved in cell wall biosynthesis